MALMLHRSRRCCSRAGRHTRRRATSTRAASSARRRSTAWTTADRPSYSNTDSAGGTLVVSPPDPSDLQLSVAHRDVADRRRVGDLRVDRVAARPIEVEAARRRASRASGCRSRRTLRRSAARCRAPATCRSFPRCPGPTGTGRWCGCRCSGSERADASDAVRSEELSGDRVHRLPVGARARVPGATVIVQPATYSRGAWLERPLVQQEVRRLAERVVLRLHGARTARRSRA